MEGSSEYNGEPVQPPPRKSDRKRKKEVEKGEVREETSAGEGRGAARGGEEGRTERGGVWGRARSRGQSGADGGDAREGAEPRVDRGDEAGEGRGRETLPEDDVEGGRRGAKGDWQWPKYAFRSGTFGAVWILPGEAFPDLPCETMGFSEKEEEEEDEGKEAPE